MKEKKETMLMKKETFILLVWEQGGCPFIQGLYFNTPENFNYIKQLILEDIQESYEEITEVPEWVETIDDLNDWYLQYNEFHHKFWRMEVISPEHAPMNE